MERPTFLLENDCGRWWKRKITFVRLHFSTIGGLSWVGYQKGPESRIGCGEIVQALIFKAGGLWILQAESALLDYMCCLCSCRLCDNLKNKFVWLNAIPLWDHTAHLTVLLLLLHSNTISQHVFFEPYTWLQNNMRYFSWYLLGEIRNVAYSPVLLFNWERWAMSQTEKTGKVAGCTKRSWFTKATEHSQTLQFFLILPFVASAACPHQLP